MHVIPGAPSTGTSFPGSLNRHVIPGHIGQVACDLFDVNPESRDSGFTPSSRAARGLVGVPRNDGSFNKHGNRRLGKGDQYSGRSL
jgi:hypothetical protein